MASEPNVHQISADRAASPADAGAAGLRPFPLLKPGDRVALFTPASHLGQNWRALLDDALGILRGWDLQVAEQAVEPRKFMYLAGADQARADEFQSYYCDPEIKAMFAARGGYGVSRMLPLLDAQRIAQAPSKAVVGFSDIAALFIYLHRFAGICGLHAPCLAPSGGLDSPCREQNLTALHDAIFEGAYRQPFDLAPLTGGRDRVNSGAATIRGRLVGGNLTLVTGAIGTPWELDTRGCILFLEEVDEKPYRIDRMVTHLRTAGKLDGVHAVVLGQMIRCDDNKPELLQQVLEDLFGSLDVPVLSGLPVGHGDLNLSIPLGSAATLEFNADGCSRLKFE